MSTPSPSGAPSAPPPLIIPDINISKGVDGIFVGYVLSTILLGVTILQAWNYAHNNRDSWKLRSLVALLVSLDIGSTVSSSIFIHKYLIEHFGNFLLLSTVNHGFLVEFIITVVVIFLVQLFFASRVHMLKPKNYILPGLIVLTAVLGFGASIYTIVEQFRHNNVSDLDLAGIRISVGFDQVMILFSDGIATVVLCWHFAKARTQSRVRGTVAILQNLLAYTVTRGLLVTLTDVVFMIMFFINRTNLDWMPLHLSLSKLYVITMIALLNARPGNKRNNQVLSEMNSFHLSTTGPTNTIGSTTRRPQEFSLPSKNFSDSPNERKDVLITEERAVYDDSHKFSAV